METGVLMEQLNNLNRLGISIQEFGPNTFKVDAIPQIFGNVDIKDLIANLLQRLADYQDEDSFHKEQIRLISLAASRAAISKSRRLSMEESQSLLNQLMLCQMPYQCPQGKPTMANLNNDELAKQFLK